MGIKKEIELYHGTTCSHGDSIISSGEFYLSSKNKEWLGRGIYFFSSKRDAMWWAEKECKKPRNHNEKPVILSATLMFDEDRYLDLSADHHMELFNREMKEVLLTIGRGKTGSVSRFSSKEELMCYCANYYKRRHNLQLISYRFPWLKDNESGFSYVWTQEQFCATDNSIIKEIRQEGR